METNQRLGSPPVTRAEEPHDRWNHQCSNHGGVDGDGDGDPLGDLTLLSTPDRVHLVVKGGEVVKSVR